jgi:hypothetical protein
MSKTGATGTYGYLPYVIEIPQMLKVPGETDRGPQEVEAVGHGSVSIPVGLELMPQGRPPHAEVIFNTLDPGTGAGAQASEYIGRNVDAEAIPQIRKRVLDWLREVCAGGSDREAIPIECCRRRAENGYGVDHPLCGRNDIVTDSITAHTD